MKYTVTGGDGRSMELEADNWFTAMGQALATWGVDPSEFDQVLCKPRGSGFSVETNTGRWSVGRVIPPPQLKIVASARSTFLEDDPTYDPLQDAEPDEVFDAPPPIFAMPQSSLAKEPVESLAERLFDMGTDMFMAEEDEAMAMALGLVQEFAPCKMINAVRGSINDDSLTYLACRGPVADAATGRKVPFGLGIVGMCFDMRQTVLVEDTSTSIPFDGKFDRDTGFETTAVLAVPILDEDGQVYGVLELLNPDEGDFSVEEIEAVESIAQTLGQALANR